MFLAFTSSFFNHTFIRLQSTYSPEGPSRLRPRAKPITFSGMSNKRGGQSRNDSKGLSYVAPTPSFLKNFGKPPPSPPSASTGGREPLPQRPKDGEWAGGSDDEGKDGSEDDEWGETFGGGGEEGPQVVVLKEGRHLTGEEVKRERRRGVSGFASYLPLPDENERNIWRIFDGVVS